MTNTVKIEASYFAGTSALVDLPEGRTWEEVSDWYVKWDTLYLTFKDGKEAEIIIHSETMDIIDWKRPTNVSVYEVDEEGESPDDPIEEI